MAHDRFTLIDLPAEKRRVRFAADVAAGLAASPKHLSCCYFYDGLGSRLFEAICELPEYYLTRAEAAILRAHAAEIAALYSGPTDLIELGSGSAAKTRLLIDALLRRHPAQRYVPIDICRTVLEESARELLQTYSGLEILAIAGEYHDGLEHLRARVPADVAAPARGPAPRLIVWLGSNIGNLERSEAAQFLRRMRATLSASDRLLVGIDLRKDSTVLEAAYDDPCGVTGAFNRNLLARINRELGGRFDLRAFEHRAIYNEKAGRIEMYLVSTRTHQVRIDSLGIDVHFAAEETIHTENSYKYSADQIAALASAAGLRLDRAWRDPDGLFQSNLLARAP
jgi:dimethylhistidine N-methyltransferase